MSWLFEILNELKNRAWYGKITVHFEAGKITFVRKEETLKPPKQ